MAELNKRDKNWFEKFSTLMDQNIRGAQYAIYSIAGLGIVLTLRSVRPFAKFSFPSDIPRHFIKRKVSFVGNVNVVQPSSSLSSNPLLLVDHRPLIAITNRHLNDGLPLEISSINITGNGFLWMQNLLTKQDVNFVPLRTTKDRVYSVVFNKNQNIGQHLVSIGFAVVSPIDVTLQNDRYYLKYYKGLLTAEKKAEKKGAGVWAEEKVRFPRLVLNKFKSLMRFSA